MITKSFCIKVMCISLALTALGHGQNDRPQISRLILSGTPPRSIAIGYQGGFNTVFNSANITPLYIWKGGFIDDRNETNGRGGNACSIRGARVNLGIPTAPLRMKDAKTVPEVITFKGYTRPRGKPPVFSAEVDHTAVSFTITSNKDNEVSLDYAFQVPLAATGYYLTGSLPAEKVMVASPLTWKDGVVTIPKGTKNFSIGINLAGKKAEVVKVVKLTGKQLYGQHCAACHSLTGQKVIGPSFKALFGKKEIVLVGGKETEIVVDDRYLRDSIINPQKEITKGFTIAPMPSFKDVLKKEEIDALIQFIKTL